MASSRLAALALVVGVLVGAGCGGGDAPPEAVRPVPVQIVPSGLLAGEVSLASTASEDAAKALGQLPEKALVSEARLWELRRGDELIGALQVSTLKAKVDLTDDRERNQIVKGVLSGTIRTAQVGDVLVLSAKSPDKKSVYFWFRDDLRIYQVLQLKTGKLDHKALVEELVGYQQTHASDPPPVEQA